MKHINLQLCIVCVLSLAIITGCDYELQSTNQRKTTATTVDGE